MSTRTDRLVELLADAGADAILVTNLVNVRYLTGFTGSNAVALVGPEVRAFATDFRYVEQAAAELDVSFDRLPPSPDVLEAITDVLPPRELRVGFEDAHLSVREHARLRERLPDRLELVPLHGLVEKLRAVKAPEEVAAIRAATELADTAFGTLIGQGLVGHSERALAVSLEFEMRRLGAEGPSFEPIVAAGPHGALPHARPRDVEITRGQLVVVDWGAQLAGYCSDCTRTLAAGSVNERGADIYELVVEAQLTGVGAVAAGRSARDLDRVARQIIDSRGHGDHFGHGLGHGVGLEVHEAPRLSQRSDAVLEPGNVVTIEPAVYLPGELGVRIEDLVVVTGNGHEILTGVSNELAIID